MKTTAMQCLSLILKFITIMFMIFLMRLQWTPSVQSKSIKKVWIVLNVAESLSYESYLSSYKSGMG